MKFKFFSYYERFTNPIIRPKKGASQTLANPAAKTPTQENRQLTQDVNTNHNKHSFRFTKTSSAHDTTPLLTAINQDSSLETITTILSQDSHINYRNIQGETALFIAAKNGQLKIVSALMAREELDYSQAYDFQGRSPYQIALDNGHFKVATLIAKNLKKSRKKFNKEKSLKSGFLDYAIRNKAFPSRRLYRDFLNLPKKNNSTNEPLSSHPSATSDYAAHVWDKLVAETNFFNKKTLQKYPVKTEVLQRLASFEGKNTEKLYHRCLDYLRNYTVALTAFNAGKINKELKHYRLLNVYETGGKSNLYRENRYRCELKLFSYLSETLKQQLFSNPALLPRYGFLHLPGREKPMGAISKYSSYGSSFMVWPDKQKFLFAPGDTLNFFNAKDDGYILSSLDTLELLLWQCPNEMLRRIVVNIKLEKIMYDLGGYIEVLLPPTINPLEAEHIYINPVEKILTPDEVNFFKKQNVSYSNSDTPPYTELIDKLFFYIQTDNDEAACMLLKRYPSLLFLPNQEGKLPIHVAAQYNAIKSFILLQEMGADPHTTQFLGKSSMQLARENQAIEIIELLTEDKSQLQLSNGFKP